MITFEPAKLPEWVYCAVCGTDRESKYLVDGCCPQCEGPVDVTEEEIKPVAPVAPPEPPEQPVVDTPPVKKIALNDKVSTEEQAEAYRLPFEEPVAQIDPDIDRELASKALCRRRLLPFIQKFRPKYDAGWVHKDICRRLERFVKDVEDGKEPRLLLMMPPRAGKSEIGSRHLPPWILGKHPEWEIIAASHTSSLTMSFSRYVRDLVRDPVYTAIFPGTKLDPASQSVENWNIIGGGGYLAAGVGTGITGRGAHILLLDDLVKDIEAADSTTIRDNTWEWYASTAYTRLAPGGGVIGIMCMTGDTPVLMADGSTHRLDALKPSDVIATYRNGACSTSTVTAFKSNGRDSVSRILTESGRIVRANQRHPFLTVAPDGELVWTRVRGLTTAHKIVILKGSEGSGQEFPALLKGATNLPSAGGCANLTTASRSGLTGIVAQVLRTLTNVVKHGLSTATALLSQSTTQCSLSSMECAPSVRNHRQKDSLSIGGSTSPSTTATTPVRSEGCSATTATQESDTLGLSPWHLPQPGISDFTLDEIVSIEPDGEEEVFDVQVADTENFIANGLVSHNTWWHDDDWAGRIQQVMETGEGDKFEIIRYPAINDKGDEYRLVDDSIVQIEPLSEVPEGATLTRPHNTAIHPARYTTEAMLRIKRNLYAAGQQRVWNALYQQNPAPDDGLYFTKDMFRYYSSLPHASRCHVYQAWDFAITENTESDYTVGATIYQDENDALYVVDIARFKSGDSFYIVDQILDYAAQWNVTLLGVEDGQIWKAMQALYDKRSQERKQYFSYEIMKPLTDKLVRASPLRGRMQQGKVYFPENAPWFRELYHEMTRFPAGKHDDQIDALSWVTRLTLSRAAPQPRDRHDKIASWKDRLNSYGGRSSAGHMAA